MSSEKLLEFSQILSEILSLVTHKALFHALTFRVPLYNVLEKRYEIGGNLQ